MSGLVKAKKYDWKDSNLSMFGSDTDRAVKKEAAETEPAWKNAGKKVGLQIWRINQFKVESWPPARYGQFYSGDSYIILNTYKDDEGLKLLYDVHFWIGKKSTQDEYGTAAYKTVELDTLLDDVPVQHREVQGHESSMFRSYFKTLVYNEGGAPTGFRHVEEKKPDPPRLYRITSQGNQVKAFQVKVARSYVKSDDCFILDDGVNFYQFIGSTAKGSERYKARLVIDELLKPCRPEAQIIVVEEEDGGDLLEDFYEALEKADAAIDDDEDELQQQMDCEQEEKDSRRVSKLIKVSDAGGEISYQEVKEGGITKNDFKSNDVFIFDSPGHGVFVWNGSRASENETSNGFFYAQAYLKKTSYFYVPITVLKESQESKDFRTALAA